MPLYKNGKKIGPIYLNGKRIDLIYRRGELIYVSSRNHNKVEKSWNYSIETSESADPKLDKSGNYLSVTGRHYIYLLDISSENGKASIMYNFGSGSASETLIDSENNLIICDDFSIYKKKIPTGETIKSHTYLYSSDNQNTIIRGQTSTGDYVVTNLTTSEIYLLDKDSLELKTRKTMSYGSAIYDCVCCNGIIAFLQGGSIYIINETNLSVIASLSFGGTNNALKLLYVKNFFFVIGNYNFSSCYFNKNQGSIYRKDDVSHSGSVSYEFGTSDGYFAYYATSDNICHKIDEHGKEISSFSIGDSKYSYNEQSLYVDRKNAILINQTDSSSVSKFTKIYQY